MVTQNAGDVANEEGGIIQLATDADDILRVVKHDTRKRTDYDTVELLQSIDRNIREMTLHLREMTGDNLGSHR